MSLMYRFFSFLDSSKSRNKISSYYLLINSPLIVNPWLLKAFTLKAL